MTITDAALKAGYSPKSPGQAGSQALHRVALKMPEVLDAAGLTDKGLVDKYLKPGLEATETKVFSGEDGLVYSKELVAWGPRLTALDMAFRLKDRFPNKQIEHSGVILHVMTETEKKEATESLRRIAAFEGDENSENILEGEVVEP